MFNFGFVFDQHLDVTPYKPVLRKLTLCMRSMELEGEFLFTEAKRVRAHGVCVYMCRVYVFTRACLCLCPCVCVCVCWCSHVWVSYLCNVPLLVLLQLRIVTYLRV